MREEKFQGAKRAAQEKAERVADAIREDYEEQLERVKNAKDFTKMNPELYGYSVWDNTPSDPATGQKPEASSGSGGA